VILVFILKQIDLSLSQNLTKKGFLAGSKKFGKTIAFLAKQIFFTASIHIVKV